MAGLGVERDVLGLLVDCCQRGELGVLLLSSSLNCQSVDTQLLRRETRRRTHARQLLANCGGLA